MAAASKSLTVPRILVRSALWFCACNVLAAVLAAQCSNPAQVPNGTYTSGDHSATDNNALSASSFVISGSATATFVAGNCIQLLPGFHATAGTAPTTFHAGVETTPSNISVSPSSGSGLTQPFTWTVSSPSGYSNLSDVYALLNTSVSGANACYIRYNRPSNLLYLADNSGANWSAGFVPGSGGSASNSQCNISGSGSSVSGNGNQLAVTVPVTFQASFAGMKSNYLIAYDNAGLNSTWQQMGTWTVPGPPPPSPLQTFVNCLSGTGTGTCDPLPAGKYVLSQPITIGRSNVTASGGSTDRSQTVLLRDPSYTGPMMRVDAASPLSGINIQNLTFCGGSYPGNPCPGNSSCQAPSSFCHSAYVAAGITDPQGQTTCGQWLADNTLNGTNHPFCTDLEIDHADTGQNPANPFTYTGPYSVTVNNVDFEYAGGHALSLFGNDPSVIPGGKRVNDIYIHDSATNFSGLTGILMGANGPALNQRICDANANFANDTSVYLPRNIRIENSTFLNNSTGVVAASARWVGLRNNTFTDNFVNPQGWGNSYGGGIVFEQCADTVSISGNTVSYPHLAAFAPLSYQTMGFELWGRNITITGNNTISGAPNEAIIASNTLNVTVTSNTLPNNDRVITQNPTNPAFKTGGIATVTVGPGACDSIPRDNQNMTITGNSIQGTDSPLPAYGIVFLDRGTSRNTIQGLTISGNSISGYSDYDIAIANPIISLTPPQTYQIVEDTLNTPRALAPDVSPPAQPRCSTPGNDRATFTFSASDKQGPTNVASVETVFSIGGADTDGAGGPDNGAHGCHFLYIPWANVLYLDGPEGGNTWTSGSSIVGSGGVDLSNGYCTVHAGSATSGYSMEAKILNVKLDIEFLPSSTLAYRKHMYVVALNNQGRVSNGGNWTYWGWWATPGQ
jgi:hypothetical protein